MNFADAMTLEAAGTLTENGAYALNTTGGRLLDFFSVAGALRGQDPIRVQRLFADAFAEDPLGALRTLFYLRDVRGGLGERSTFRLLIRYAAEHYPREMGEVVHLIPEYGRWDDLYVLIGTPAEALAWTTMYEQWKKDLLSEHPSLLAKWIKSPNSHSKETKALGLRTAEAFGYTPAEMRKSLSKLRARLRLVETKMSANQWTEIEYPAVPSRAMSIYNKAFNRHDQVGFDSYMKNVKAGTAKINADTLYPYDILKQVFGLRLWTSYVREDAVANAQWNALPDYVGDHSAIVIADTSGSMFSGAGRVQPIYVALSLAIYFAERNKGPYKGLWMSFSGDSAYQRLKGQTIAQKVASIDMKAWGNSTNLAAAFDRTLATAIANRVQPDDLPQSIIVISDMEIDVCGARNWTFYDTMAQKYADAGYTIPNVIFWNVDSRHDTYHADARRKGVQLVSGASPSVFKQVMGLVGTTPVEAMYKILNSPRYEAIKIRG